MENKDKHIFESLKYDHKNEYWYYTCPVSVRRSGRYRISDKFYNKLKAQYEEFGKDGYNK